MVTTNKILENKIRLSWKKMTKKEKEIGEMVIAKHINIDKKSITSLAKELDCSISTINRWAKKLGFDGYKGLSANIGVQSGYIDKYGQGFSMMENDVIYSISTTEHFLDYDDLEVCCKKINELKNIIFYGEAFTYLIAEYFSHLFSKIGINSRVINVASEIALINNTENAVNIFVSISGKNANILRGFEKAAFGKKIFAVEVTTNSKSLIKHNVNCSLISDFNQTFDVDPFEIPLISKMAVDFTLIKLFYAVYLSNEQQYKKLVSKIAKDKAEG